jgi:phosphate transport system permease protein
LTRAQIRARVAYGVLLACAVFVALVIFSILFFVGKEGMLVFKDVNPLAFFFGLTWNPPQGQYGALPFLIGSLGATAIALLIGAPLGLAGAIFMAKIAPGPMRTVLRQASNLFVGIPSVVYGYIGMTLLVPWVRDNLGGQGFGILVAGFILSVMILPTILSVSEDAIRDVHPSLEEGSLGLGATRWQTIRYVIVPAAKTRILAGIILAFARAFGETTAVQMVIGNSPRLLTGLTNSTASLTSQIIMEMGQTPPGSTWNRALFMMAFGLLLISLLLILLVRRITSGREAK